MKLEAGKKYVLASGQVVGPLWDELQEGGVSYKYLSNDVVGGYIPIWNEDGSADFFSNPEDNFPKHNVFAEYVELT